MRQNLLPSSCYITLNPGGQLVECSPEGPGTVIGRMSGIWDVEYACGACKETPAMAELTAHLRRLSPRSPTPKGGLCFRNVVCDISHAWERVCAGGKAHVLAGRSNKGGTLILAFVPTLQDTCVVEVDCRS